MSRAQVTDEQIAEAQGGNGDAMWDIVSAYEPMMKGIIARAAPSAGRDDAEDLLQEARAVLIQRIRAYDSSKSSAELGTFAYRAIWKVVAEEGVRSSSALSVDPSTVLRVKRALFETEGDSERAWLIVSTDADPRHRMGRETFVSVMDSLSSVERLESVVTHDLGVIEGWTLGDTIPDTSADFTDVSERRNLARYLLSEIPPRQSLALRAFYGIGMTETPDAEIAADMGVKLAALRKLRSNGVISARAVATTQALAA